MLIIIFSIADSQVSMGRGYRRTIDMFHAARDLVEENERRLELDGIEDDEDFTEK